MSLLYKPLESIAAADLQGLIDNQVRESLYIEYKTEPFDRRDDKKRVQFLGSISAFANAAGGDLLVGVKARAPDFRRLSPVQADRLHEIPQGDWRYNLDGVLMRGGPKWQTQLFRNGSIEYAASNFEDRGPIDAWFYQTDLLRALQRFFVIQRRIGVVPPLTLMVSFLNVANLRV